MTFGTTDRSLPIRFQAFTYMLAVATQRSDSDPYDKTSPPIAIGPHWIIMWPFDPKTTGLPTTHKSTGAYIMWADTPYAHLQVMGIHKHVDRVRRSFGAIYRRYQQRMLEGNDR
jgi:hypothetical protein